jgi:hypothetical protein
MSVNRTVGARATGRAGATGAGSGVTWTGGGAGFRFSQIRIPIPTTANASRSRTDHRVARPITASSTWTNSSGSFGAPPPELPRGSWFEVGEGIDGTANGRGS